MVGRTRGPVPSRRSVPDCRIEDRGRIGSLQQVGFGATVGVKLEYLHLDFPLQIEWLGGVVSELETGANFSSVVS